MEEREREREERRNGTGNTIFTEKRIFTDDYSVEVWELGYGTSRFAHKSTCNLQCMPWTPVRHSSGNAAARPSYSYRVRRCGTPSIVAQNCFLSTMVGDKTANR